MNAAQGHAAVLGFDDYSDTAGLELVIEPIGDLFGQPFLALRAAGEVFGDAVSFDSPMMRSPGRYPMCAIPTNGNMWCSHTDRTGRLREMTSSSYRSSLGKVVRSKLRG